MKKFLIFFVILLIVSPSWAKTKILSSTMKNAVEEQSFQIPLIGDRAPSFTAESTKGTLNFPDDYGRKWKILFSHPQDYTPVCTSEILELAAMQEEFDKKGVKIVVVSVDPIDSHIQWKKSMEGLNYKNRINVKIDFPLVSDENVVISKKYGMIHPKSNSTKTVRGVFIIDPENIIQAIYFYPLNVGRSTEEIIRMVQALQTVASDNIMTPANWILGDDVLIPSLPQEEINNPKLKSEGIYSLAWYLWFKKMK